MLKNAGSNFKICTLRTFFSVKISAEFPVATIFLDVSLILPNERQELERMFGAHRISTFIDCYQSCIVAVSFTKDLSRVSILSSTSCLNTGIENDLLTMQDYKPMVLLFSPRGHHFSVAVIPSWGCFCFGTFCFVFGLFPQLLPVVVDCWTATFHGLRHIWALFNFRLSTYHYYVGCRGGCGLHLLTVESPSSASRFFFCTEMSWRRLSNVRLKPAGNTEELQPATAAKAISNSQSFFFYCFWALLLYCEQKLKWW